jgi:hypothetical protein
MRKRIGSWLITAGAKLIQFGCRCRGWRWVSISVEGTGPGVREAEGRCVFLAQHSTDLHVFLTADAARDWLIEKGGDACTFAKVTRFVGGAVDAIVFPSYPIPSTGPLFPAEASAS